MYVVVSSWASGPPGFAISKFADLGDYDVCLGAQSPSNEFIGKYCLLLYSPPVDYSYANKLGLKSVYNLSGSFLEESWLEHGKRLSTGVYMSVLRVGICIPSTCENSDLKDYLKSMLTREPFGGNTG